VTSIQPLGGVIPRGYTPRVGTVGGNIRRIREKLGVSQVELADRLEMRQPAIWKLENQEGLPEAGTLLKLAKALPCLVEELLEGVDSAYDKQRRVTLADRRPGEHGADGGPNVPSSVVAELHDLRKRVETQQALIDQMSGLASQMLAAGAKGGARRVRAHPDTARRARKR
jgi:transcriptional regulator with XRE-family HTH domain